MTQHEQLKQAARFALEVLLWSQGGEPVPSMEREAIKQLKQALGIRETMTVKQLTESIKRGERWQVEPDPCPGCQRGSVCRTPQCGRLKLAPNHPYRQAEPATNIGCLGMPVNTPVTSAQNTAEPVPKTVIPKLKPRRLPDDDVEAALAEPVQEPHSKAPRSDYRDWDYQDQLDAEEKQPPQEPEACMDMLRRARNLLSHPPIWSSENAASRHRLSEEITAFITAPPQRTAEPVAWMNGWGDLFKHPDAAERGQTLRPLYTHPPQRPKVTKMPPRKLPEDNDE